MTRLMAVAVVAAALGPVVAARADIVALSGPEAFDGTATLLNFEQFQPFDPVSTVGDLTFSRVGLNDALEAASIPNSTQPRAFGPTGSIFIQNLTSQATFPLPDISISFAQDQRAFAAAIALSDGVDLTVTTLANGVQTDTLTFDGQGKSQFAFYGIGTTDAFDQIVLHAFQDGSDAFASTAISLDNVVYAATFNEDHHEVIPEPATASFGLALGALALVRRRGAGRV